MSEHESLVEATEVAIAAATHLTDADQGAVEALRALARRIDTDDEVREAHIAWHRDRTGEAPLRALQLDNVSLPTYLKYSDALGLTPAGRKALVESGVKVKRVGKLAGVSNIPRPA